ncbi:thioredoxin domain-containing protein [Candidatus Woesearchaeota archaeon]|nr:thioredoxin domain-containing protein [Candidatus Woesearchaeota archaeon]
MKEHKEELSKLQRELSHLEKTYKTGIITDNEYQTSKNAVMKKLNKLMIKLRHEEASKRVVDEILKEKLSSTVATSKTHDSKKSIKGTAKKISSLGKSSRPVKQENKNEITSKTPKFPNEDNDAFWNGVVYILVLLLVLAATFTTYRYYEAHSQLKVVTIYEFTDFQSKNSRNVQKALSEIKDEYSDQVKIILKHYPLEEIHPDSVLAAEALECAAEQGEFRKFHNFLFNAQKELSSQLIKEFAQEQELNSEVFNDCLESHKKLDKVKADIEEGKQLGVTAVPTFIIDGHMLVGNQKYEVFKYYIDQALN